MGRISDNGKKYRMYVLSSKYMEQYLWLLLYNYIFTLFAPIYLTVTFRKSKFGCRPRDKINKNILFLKNNKNWTYCHKLVYYFI
jgi:hypothetical protein